MCMDKGSLNAGVYHGLFRSTSCTPERSTSPTRPLGYIAQLGILSYKGGYKDEEEEDTVFILWLKSVGGLYPGLSYQIRKELSPSVVRAPRNTPLSVSRSCVPPPHAHASSLALQATIAVNCELGAQQGEIRAPVNLTRRGRFFFLSGWYVQPS